MTDKPSPPNPGDPVVPLADAVRILTGYGVSSGAYTFEDAHRDINAAAVLWPATPTALCNCLELGQEGAIRDDCPEHATPTGDDQTVRCPDCKRLIVNLGGHACECGCPAAALGGGDRSAPPTGHTTIRIDALEQIASITEWAPNGDWMRRCKTAGDIARAALAATPTGHTTVRADDLVAVLDPDTFGTHERARAKARLRAALPQDAGP